jgi:hypothetical protein
VTFDLVFTLPPEQARDGKALVRARALGLDPLLLPRSGPSRLHRRTRRPALCTRTSTYPIAMSQSLAKLTSTSTQTLSLLLERERAQTFAGADSGRPGLHTAKITRNLQQLRTGVLALETQDGPSDASKLLRGQYERMRQMLGEDGEDLEPYVCSPETS